MAERLDAKSRDELRQLIVSRLGENAVRDIRISFAKDSDEEDVVQIEIDLNATNINHAFAKEFVALTRHIRVRLEKLDLKLFPMISPRFIEGPDELAS